MGARRASPSVSRSAIHGARERAYAASVVEVEEITHCGGGGRALTATPERKRRRVSARTARRRLERIGSPRKPQRAKSHRQRSTKALMAHDKLLAEWFWTDRWMGSSAFGLPLEARGLYREMLTQAWRRGAHLPNDHEQIRRVTGVTVKEWRRTWPLVKRFWRVDGDDLVNDTQQEIYANAHALTVKRSIAGRL